MYSKAAWLGLAWLRLEAIVIPLANLRSVSNSKGQGGIESGRRRTDIRVAAPVEMATPARPHRAAVRRGIDKRREDG